MTNFLFTIKIKKFHVLKVKKKLFFNLSLEYNSNNVVQNVVIGE